MDYSSQLRHDLRGSGERKSLSHLLEGESPVLRQEEVSQAMRRRSANINLQKSIRLLDETVGTPPSMRKTPRVLRHSAYTPRHVPSGSKFDVSAIGLGTPGASIIATPSMRANFGESTSESHLYTTPRKGPDYPESTIMEEEITTTNVALLKEDPTFAASTGMFDDFKNFDYQMPSDAQLFELLAQYEQVCGDNVTLLKKLLKSTVPGQHKFNKTVDMCRSINCEKKTWRLISNLYRDRLETDGKRHDSDSDMVVDNMMKTKSENEIITTMFEREDAVRQAQIVVDWLEKNSEEELEDCYDNVEFFTDSAGAWENSLHYLKNKPKSTMYDSQRVMVTELDPDAPIRQRRPLHDLDIEDEVRLLKHMFAFVRAGQIEEAKNLSNKVGHYWRAATLEGWRLSHDPNYNGDTIGQPMEGNAYRDIWKNVCWKMSEEEQFNQYERGLYAAFSGNLRELLCVCETWEDYVWAYARCMVDVKVEQELRVNHSLNREWAALPAAYWNKMLSMETIFEEIQASLNERVRIESSDRHRVMQKYIILDDVDRLVEDMAEWTRDEASPCDPQLLRFMAHLVLFFRRIRLNTKDHACECILEAYVSHLVRARKLHLVAFYVATLQTQHQVNSYAAFLEGITEREERLACLAYAEESGLDVAAITRCVVTRMRQKDSTEFHSTAELGTEVSTNPEDKLKISAIDWLVFDETQRSEAMKQANALMRTFVAAQKLGAAREVFNKLPSDSIDIIITNWEAQTGSTNLSAEDDNTIREYLCMKAFLDAHDSFNDWFQHVHHSKPSEPPNPVGANFTERVAHEHRQKQYEAELERWKHTLMLQTKLTKEKIYNVLLFIDGGWMIDQREAEGWVDEPRQHQMKLLRQLCLPPLCFLLHTILHTTEQYRECLQLADIICSEQHRLYTVFRRDEMQKLLQKLRESSVKLLDQNLDPLGYPLS